MRTRSRSRSRNSSPQREASPAIVEPLHIELPFLEDRFQEDPPPESLMADNQTMAELLQAPTEGGNFLDKMPRECLKIIESKSKVRQSRAKAVVAKDMVKALLLDKKNQSPAPTPSTTAAPVKAVEPNCVTCGGAHSYQNCLATHENAYRDNIQEYVSQAAAVN
nr:hypothetical protein [Tanacetum cinerariifolium]